MTNGKASMTIGGFAKAAGVGVETIRFYQRKGLLREPLRPPGGVRRYGEADVARVRFIKSAQRLGFSLQEVCNLLRLDDGTQCAEAARIGSRHLEEVRARMRDLARLETVLSELVERCAQQDDPAVCPLITALREERGTA